MPTKTIWISTAAIALLILIWALAYGAVLTYAHNLNLTAYLDCLTKYQIAKQSGRLPSDVKPPSGSEVCAKYK